MQGTGPKKINACALFVGLTKRLYHGKVILALAALVNGGWVYVISVFTPWAH